MSGSLQPHRRRPGHYVDVCTQKILKNPDHRVDFCIQWIQESTFGTSGRGQRSSTEWGTCPAADVAWSCKDSPRQSQP